MQQDHKVLQGQLGQQVVHKVLLAPQVYKALQVHKELLVQQVKTVFKVPQVYKE